MKKHILFLAISALSIGLSSCGGDKKTVEDSSQQEKNCFYSYNSGSTVLEWTAFKFTEKKGVAGTFNKITIEGMEKSDDPKKMIESLTFSIETASVETQNEERNGKIAKLFFGTISTPTITGKVKSLSDNGKATIEIEMNKIKKDIEAESRAAVLRNALYFYEWLINDVDRAGKGLFVGDKMEEIPPSFIQVKIFHNK